MIPLGTGVEVTGLIESVKREPLLGVNRGGRPTPNRIDHQQN